MAECSRGAPAFIALPVFPSRIFRHSAIYVRSDAAIASPRQLIGRRVGAPLYGQTAVLAARGVLRDDYGVRPSDLEWVVGPLEPGEARASLRRPAAEVSIVESGDKPLDAMLLDGELDALFTAAAPASFRRRDPRVRRLWPDVRAAERSWFERTGVFPIMHVLGLRAELARERPDLPAAIGHAFEQARRLAIEALDGQSGASKVTLPWASLELEEARALMGEDFWSYGVEANRSTIETMARWSFDQGLSARLTTPAILFPLEPS